MTFPFGNSAHAMKKKWTRREFVETSLIGAIVLSGQGIRFVGAPLVELQSQSEKNPWPVLASDLRKVLRAAADEIIPKSDGMPAASGVETLRYLDGVLWQSPTIRREFQLGLRALEAVSRDGFKKSFLKLSRANRVKALTEFEKAQPTFFAMLRDFVYEGYYLQPQVWKFIGYEFYPSQRPVPSMKPFDEAVLAKVRKRPKVYREVG